ncbi:hypothetical protein [Aulosira sp. FACHB-615]|uniref:hypothetical protein n=1 Tax=Aulosira sp. FACHB-615 TaxID=2692777 RepID=UPI0016875419|nr:hypothetical protein [Aulosira sp. FACHB-615]MBD2492532.1 hypothetical protein [Aulosira sp. FACHB-615]
MARRSRWEHLKDEIVQHCKDGKTPVELAAMYPDVPRATIHGWYDLAYADSENNPKHFRKRSEDIKTIASQDIQVIPPTENKLVALDGGEQLSDFALARRALRDAIKNPTKPGTAIKIQASFGLLKLTQMRAELPRHVLDEIEVTGVDEERDRIKEVSLEELQQQYKDVVNG